MMRTPLIAFLALIGLPVAAAHYLTEVSLPVVEPVEEFVPTRIHCVPAHEVLGHCRSSNLTATAGATASASTGYSSNGTALPSEASVWTGTSLALSVAIVQSAPSDTSVVYTLAVDDTVGIYWTGARNVTLTLRGNDSGTVTFPLETPDAWFHGDRVFPYVRIGHAGVWDGIFTTLAFEDPAIGGESVRGAGRLPPFAGLILLGMVVGAIVLAYTRGRWD